MCRPSDSGFAAIKIILDLLAAHSSQQILFSIDQAEALSSDQLAQLRRFWSPQWRAEGILKFSRTEVQTYQDRRSSDKCGTTQIPQFLHQSALRHRKLGNKANLLRPLVMPRGLSRLSPNLTKRQSSGFHQHWRPLLLIGGRHGNLWATIVWIWRRKVPNWRRTPPRSPQHLRSLRRQQVWESVASVENPLDFILPSRAPQKKVQTANTAVRLSSRNSGQATCPPSRSILLQNYGRLLTAKTSFPLISPGALTGIFSKRCVPMSGECSSVSLRNTSMGVMRCPPMYRRS